MGRNSLNSTIAFSYTIFNQNTPFIDYYGP